MNLGVLLKDKKRNEVIRKMLGLGVACITVKIREARLRCYGHVMRREHDNRTKRIMTVEDAAVQDGRRSLGGGDIIQQDMKLSGVTRGQGGAGQKGGAK